MIDTQPRRGAFDYLLDPIRDQLQPPPPPPERDGGACLQPVTERTLMAAIDELIRHSWSRIPDARNEMEWTVRCALCGHQTVWRYVYLPKRFPSSRPSRNAREGAQARMRIVQHIKATHPEAYAGALERDSHLRKQRAEERARHAEYEASKTPYQRGQEDAHMHMAAIERYNAAPDDRCPYKKGTPEESEYDRGWKAAMRRDENE